MSQLNLSSLQPYLLHQNNKEVFAIYYHLLIKSSLTNDVQIKHLVNKILPQCLANITTSSNEIFTKKAISRCNC